MGETEPPKQTPTPRSAVGTRARRSKGSAIVAPFVNALQTASKTSFSRTFGLALVFWLVLQFPGASRTFLWEADRQMMDAAFKLRQGALELSTPPVLWIDVSDLSGNQQRKQDVALPSVVPRESIAAALRWARRGKPSVVILDVDIAFADQDAAANKELNEELSAWGSDPSSPKLILVREPMLLGGALQLPATEADKIVERAHSIEWGSAFLCKDERAQVRSIPPPLPISGTDLGLASVVDLATAAIKKVSFTSEAVASPCDKSNRPDSFFSHERLIDWHIGPRADGSTLGPAPSADADLSQNPRVSPNWAGMDECKLTTPPNALSRQPVGSLLASAKIADTSRLCGRIVIIGADSPLFPDNSWTPLGTMPGPMILANAIRGDHNHSITNTSPRSVLSIVFQLCVLLLFVLVTVSIFGFLRQWRASLLEQSRQKSSTWGLKIIVFITSPLFVKFLVAALAFVAGVLVTAIGLSFGLWGALSAPTYIAALREAGLIMRQEGSLGERDK